MTDSLLSQARTRWAVKRELWQDLVPQVPQDSQITVIASFPVPICRFARAPGCHSFTSQAIFDYDEVARQTYYGFRAHLCIR